VVLKKGCSFFGPKRRTRRDAGLEHAVAFAERSGEIGKKT